MRQVWVCVALVAFLANAARGASAAHDEFDRKVESELAAQNAEAPALFRAATAARDREDFAAAAEGFAKVEKLVPTSAHAFRRHAGVELALKHWESARTLATKAVELDRSAMNLATQALALASDPALSNQREKATAAARKAGDLGLDDFDVQMQVAEVFLQVNDLQLASLAVDHMRALQPDAVQTWFFRAIVQASNGEFGDALELLDRAHERGLPDEAYRGMRGRIKDAQPFYQRVLPTALRLTGAWLAAGFALFLLGLVLSAWTLRASRRVSLEPNWHAGGGEVGLRRLYAAVLALCCAYYYVSIPFALAAVLLGGGGLVYLCFAVGQVPVKLVAIIIGVVVVSVYAVLKSLFVRRRDGDPGQKLRLEEHPQLARVLREVAGRVGTRAVDSVYLTPDASVAVTERGGMLTQLQGKSERCLILGIAVLDNMDAGALKAVLAHEYGHFVNRDTAGGGFALLVRRSVLTMAIGLARGGAAGWWNPAWWFVNGFHRLFLHISQGASRLQEVLADRWAATAYGGDAFERGLRHVIAADVRFDAHTNATLMEVTKAKAPLPNLYRHQLAAPVDQKAVTQKLEEIMAHKASPYDSHPAPNDRIAWVKAIRAVRAAGPDDAEPAWSWFSDRERCEREMTATVRETIRTSYGVHIPATVPTDQTST